MATQKKKAAELVICIDPFERMLASIDVLESVQKALQVNNIIKLQAKMGRMSQGYTKGHKRMTSCVRVTIPRRRFEAAHQDGTIARLLTHRAFRRQGLQIRFVSGKSDWLRAGDRLAQAA